jgi:hypothetical protein
LENNNLVLNINQNNIQKEKQKYGYYSEGFFNQDDKKYLIKKPNLNGHVNNEVYLISIIREILGNEDSISVKFAHLTDNQKERSLKEIFKANQEELKKKIRIASLWAEGTKNLMEAQLDFQKKPKNLIKVFFTSLLINNIDPNPGNILIDKENKFYLIDPLVISERQFWISSSCMLSIHR